jgi:hypothetical protein
MKVIISSKFLVEVESEDEAKDLAALIDRGSEELLDLECSNLGVQRSEVVDVLDYLGATIEYQN